MRQNWMGEPTLDSTPHLLWLGTQNQRWNRDARQILAGRGESSVFLRKYEKCLTSSTGKGGMQIRLDRDSIKPGSWLAPTPTGKCCDCGKLTARTYNNGAIFQCGGCADGVKHNGRALWRASLAGRKAALQKMEEVKEADKQVVVPAEIILAREPSFEESLKDGSDAETVKTAGDREAAQVAYEAYTEKKEELTQLINNLERAA